jgi:K+-sensing histidine kinase KdpD
METALRATADALERSNAVKDEFLGLVSHELRTPVTTILGNARLLRDHASTLDDVTKHEMISDIDEEAHRLHSVIENLLTLSRLTSAAELEHEPQLVGPTVSEEVEIFRRRHPGREIRLRSEGSPVIVEADSAHLHLLLVNFLTNADKYSPPGEPIDVVVQRAHGEVSVRVLDRGIGLGEAGAEDLFRPFFRTPSARMQASGVGIGLAVCRRIVEALGGRIWAAPREGGGSEFGFALKVSPDTYR